MIQTDNTQPRVSNGIAAQTAVIRHLEQQFGPNFELIGQAMHGHKSPDIVSTIHGVPAQIEVKGRTNSNSTVKIYEKSIKRGQRDLVLDLFAKYVSIGVVDTFEHYVDLKRTTNSSVGFPGDPGVIVKSGKFYVPVEDVKIRSRLRPLIVNTLTANSDDYFAIHTLDSGATDVYDIGSTNSNFSANRLPNIRSIRCETYGSSYKSAMRIAIKVVFKR